MKAGKAEMVGLVAALERFGATDYEAQAGPRLVLAVGPDRARAIYRALAAAPPSALLRAWLSASWNRCSAVAAATSSPAPKALR
jgi:hypothetical protein